MPAEADGRPDVWDGNRDDTGASTQVDPSGMATDQWVVNTVTGPVAAFELGIVLAHEHVYVDAHGPAHRNYLSPDWDAASRQAAAALRTLRQAGVGLVVDWTPIGMGRNATFLRHVSHVSGLPIAAATGAGMGALPPALARASVDQLAGIFVDELVAGMDHTAITATFIKVTALDGGPTSAEKRVLAAAAGAAAATGATLGIHALDGAAIRGALAVVRRNQYLDLRQVVWGHAEFASDAERLDAVRDGLTVQLDGVAVSRPAPYTIDQAEQTLLAQIEALASAGYVSQVLVSNDASLVRFPDATYAGDPAALLRDFVPRLRERLGDEVVDDILRWNPVRTFGARVAPRARRRLPHEPL